MFIKDKCSDTSYDIVIVPGQNDYPHLFILSINFSIAIEGDVLIVVW